MIGHILGNMPDSFDDRILDELRNQYPALKDEFINAHRSELMQLLQFGKSSLNSIDAKAAAIPDNIPEALFNGLSLTGAPDSMQLSTIDKKTQQCMELLNILIQKVQSTEVDSLCIQLIRRDGNMEMLFTMPCNIYAYLGFMQHAVYKSTNTEFRDPKDQV